MKNRVKNRIYDFYSSEKPATILAFLLVVLGASGFWISGMAATSPFKNPVKITFIIAWIPAIALALARLALTLRYKAIRLFLHKHTGVLYDKRLNIRNVSLRTKTVIMILRAVLNNNGALTELGSKVGQNFYDDTLDKHQLLGERFAEMDAEKKLEEWKKYDSTSGMGIFEVNVQSKQPVRVEVTVRNSFTTGDSQKGICSFLSGYIRGFCSRVFARELRCQEYLCSLDSGQDICRFRVESN